MNLRKFVASPALAVAFLAGLPAHSASAAATITGIVPTGVAASTTAGVPISLSGVEWDSVLVTIVIESGGLTIDLTGDTTESEGYDLTDNTATTQSFYGAFDSVNEVLDSGLTWHAPSSVGPHDMHFTITVQEQITGLTTTRTTGTTLCLLSRTSTSK